MNSVPGNDAVRPARGTRSLRRPRGASKDHSIRLSVTEAEFTEITQAAERAGLARAAYSTEAILSVARGAAVEPDTLLRDILTELIRANGLVRRIGVNLNQAIAKLNATGQRSGDLVPYAAECNRRSARLDAATELVRKALR
jgi:hypothetical protein